MAKSVKVNSNTQSITLNNAKEYATKASTLWTSSDKLSGAGNALATVAIALQCVAGRTLRITQSQTVKGLTTTTEKSVNLNEYLRNKDKVRYDAEQNKQVSVYDQTFRSSVNAAIAEQVFNIMAIDKKAFAALKTRLSTIVPVALMLMERAKALNVKLDESINVEFNENIPVITFARQLLTSEPEKLEAEARTGKIETSINSLVAQTKAVKATRSSNAGKTNAGKPATTGNVPVSFILASKTVSAMLNNMVKTKTDTLNNEQEDALLKLAASIDAFMIFRGDKVSTTETVKKEKVA